MCLSSEISSESSEYCNRIEECLPLTRPRLVSCNTGRAGSRGASSRRMDQVGHDM